MKTEAQVIADMLPTLSQVGGALIGFGFIFVTGLLVAYITLRENERNTRHGYYNQRASGQNRRRHH